MAQKLNKKLVFVVGSLLLVLVVIGAGILLFRYKYDAERHIRAGDQAMAANDFVKASDAYGRAVQKQRTNVKYLEKFVEATLKVKSPSENDARERYGQYLNGLASLARADRGNVERWRNYLDALIEQAEAVGAVSSWKSLSDTCNDMKVAFSAGTPGHAVAKVYSGYASMRRFDSLDEGERADAVAMLKEVANDPGLSPRERDMAYGSIARFAVMELARVRAGGIASRIESATKACDTAIAEARKASPDGVQVASAVFSRALLDAKANSSDAALLEAIDALRTAAESAKLSGLAVLDVTGMLARGGPEGAKAGAALIASYLEKNPGSLMHRRARALLSRATNRDAALAEVDAALKLERPTTGIVAASFESNRISCGLIRFDILYEALEAAKGPEREEAMKRAMAAREDVAKLLPGGADESALLRADAKLAMARGEFQSALIKLNEIFRKGSAIDFELHLLAARCSEQLGENGRALELLSAGLQLNPLNTQLLKARAQLELRTGKGDAALQTIRQIRALDPSDTGAQEMESRIAAVMAADPGTREGLANSAAAAQAVGEVQAAVEARNYARARDLVSIMRKAATEPDVRIERLAATVEMQAGDNAKAKEIVQAALTKFGNDPALIRLNAVLSSEDPVERVIAMTDAEGVPERDRAVITYLRLLQSEATVREAADREQKLGSSTGATTAKAAARLAEGLAEWRKKAEAADRLHPVLLEADFRAAMVKKDFAAADAIVKLAKGGRDVSQGPLLESQLLAEQGKLREAGEVLERAIAAGIDGSTVYRALGAMLERQGNLESALRQYEESYKRRPDDLQTVRLLVGASVRSGNLTRALEILRSARQFAGLDAEIANVWLMLEAQIGDRRLAMALRENQYRAVPSDESNSVALATMLMVSMPERADVVTEGGEPAYNEAAWQTLTDAGRNAALDKTRAAWRKRAEEIFADASRRAPASIDIAEPYSNLLRALGRDADAEKVLVDAVKAGGTDAGWRGLVALGNLQLAANKREAAQASFAEAIRREDPATRVATRTIADLLLSQERFAFAMPYLEDLAKTMQDPTIKFRLAEALMRGGRLDDARRVFNEAAAATADRPIAEELLDGALSVAAGDKARAEGKAADAKAAYEAAIAPLQRAKALAPSVAQPFIQDAALKRKLFELTAERARLQEALASADKAVSVAASFFPAANARAEVLLAGGDILGALNEYERLLKIMPTSVEARRRVVDLTSATGDFARAEATLRTAIGIAPGESTWHYALGDVLARRNRFAEAATAFSRADTLRPEPASFLRELDARIRAKDFRGVTDAARRRGDFVRTNSTARAYTGIALIAAGEQGDGTKTLVESYADAVKATTPTSDFIGEWFTALDLIYGPGDLAQVEDVLGKVMKDGLTPRARIYLATLALRGGSGGPQKAVAYLKPAESADFSKAPFEGSALFDRLGTASYMAGDCAAAVTYFEKALALTPDSDPVLNNFAYLCGECLKDPKRGLPAARRAVQINPGRVEYLDTLGTLLSADGQHKEALDLLDRAQTIANSAAIQYHRAQALVGLNRKEEARSALDAALKLNPDPPTKRGIEETQKKLN